MPQPNQDKEIRNVLLTAEREEVSTEKLLRPFGSRQLETIE